MRATATCISWVGFVAVIGWTLFSTSIVLAGDLNPPRPPAASMKSLDEIPGSWSRTLAANDGVPSGPREGCDSSRFRCVLSDTGVLDRETGLVWERTAGAVSRSQAESEVHCATTFTGGRFGWRLPSVAELGTLPDLNETTATKLPTGSPFVFPAGAGSTFWTSSPYPGQPTTQRWFATFGGPTVGFSGQVLGLGLLSWCVRGPAGID